MRFINIVHKSGSVVAHAGRPHPLGADVEKNGVNFALFSAHATAVSLLLYHGASDAEPTREIKLDPYVNKTGEIWHVFMEGVGPGALYMWRVDGPRSKMDGHRFDATIPLLDPYAEVLTKNEPWNFSGSDLSRRPKGVVVSHDFDWQGDRPLNIPMQDVIIYETHVKGLTAKFKTKNPSSFLGVIDTIPYLKSLGITSLELLPVFEYDENELGSVNPFTKERLRNYWGYSTLAFFAPKSGFAVTGSRDGAVLDFKTMVRELHKAGIEVILDVVCNHTAEGNENGPVISFKGIDNASYYTLYGDKRYYWNYSGCGNTVSCNRVPVADFIIDFLRYWVLNMHVDGFRFDLASIMARDSSGNLMDHPPLIERINEDPVLKSTKLIAEPWDAGGAYQVGTFPGSRFAEWNDRYRDQVRRYWRNDEYMASHFATRLSGSSDIYGGAGGKPWMSVNYITIHDGFTMNDLASYSRKNNMMNGLDSRDGADENYSYNYGVEGPTEDAGINAVRSRQIKNYLATLALSAGTPMFLGGDEFRRTQQGNNNAYCQDNEISWYDWTLTEKSEGLIRFLSELTAFRKANHALRRSSFFSGFSSGCTIFADISWYDSRSYLKDWASSDNSLVCLISGEGSCISPGPDCADTNDLLIMFNPSHEDKNFTIPAPRPGREWFMKLNTALESPQDIVKDDKLTLVESREIMMVNRSMIVLVSD